MRAFFCLSYAIPLAGRADEADEQYREAQRLLAKMIEAERAAADQ